MTFSSQIRSQKAGGYNTLLYTYSMLSYDLSYLDQRCVHSNTRINQPKPDLNTTSVTNLYFVDA